MSSVHRTDYIMDVTITYNDQWSGPLYGGSDAGNTYGISFLATGGEVRPKNTAMRIWKRTG